jgi:polysaccharide biosynthesis PFTS motif protein
VLASRILCWHEEARNLMLAHPQENCQALVIGPMMQGRAEVMFEERRGLRLRLWPAERPRVLADAKWVSVFDVLPYTNPPFRTPGFRAYEEPYTEEYWITFVEDVLRLLTDDPELVVVYKPKRVHMLGRRVPLAAKFPTKSDEYIRLMDTIRSHERIVMVDENENPWTAIAVADVCVSVPGSSPISAAWHFGVPGIYHDSLGTLGPEDYYPDLGWCVTHDYAGLRSSVRQFLSASAASDRDDLWPAALQHYVGRVRRSNAAAEVRELLTAHGGQRLAPEETLAPEAQAIR